MPVFSYLAYPEPGGKATLAQELAALDYCETQVADNEEILILVTDTPNEDQEKELQKKLKTLRSLQGLSMTFGHVDE